jgi:hypothetical protein
LGTRVKTFARWAAVLPAALVAWHLALVMGLAALSVLERLCPPELVISGLCTAAWFPLAEKAVLCFGTAVAAALVVASVAVVAPTRKAEAAYVSIAIGSAIALWLAMELDAWVEFASAIAAGGITVMGVRRVVARR